MKESFGDRFDEILTVEDPIFKKHVALTHEYLPPHLPHREDELKEFLSIIKWILKGEKVENCYVYGETGTGKTVVIRKAVELIENKRDELGSVARIGYVKCRESSSLTLYLLCKDLGLDAPARGISLFDYMNIIEQSIAPTLLIFDEFDKINVTEEGWKILHGFSRHPRISTIIISVRHDLCQFLPKDTLDSFRPTRIFFKSYGEQELYNITKFRAELGIKETAYDNNVVLACASEAYMRPESARFAIDMLRVSGELAREQHAEKIGQVHLSEAPKRVEELELERMLFNLPFHLKILLITVFNCTKKGKRQDREYVYVDFNTRLKDCGKSSVTKRTFNFYVQTMAHKRLLAAVRRGLGRGRGTTWFVTEGFYKFEDLIPVLVKSPDLASFVTVRDQGMRYLAELQAQL